MNGLKLLGLWAKLIIDSPKDFFYVVCEEKKPVPVYREYKKEDTVVANKIMADLKKACPKITPFLIGSTGLKIGGRGDIDLYLTAKKADFGKVIPKLVSMLGQPEKTSSRFAEWKSKLEGYIVETVLIDAREDRFIQQINLFNKLKNNKELLRKYDQLKRDYAGKTGKEYIYRRMDLFNNLLKD